MKWCRHCKIYHDTTAENWLSIEGRSLRCRVHYQSATKRWREANKEKVRYLNKQQKKSVGTKYSMLKSNALKRKLEVRITKEEFSALINNECHYCSSKEVTGLDRIDNSIGYHKENCVPSCSLCNMTRNNFYSYEEFKKHIVPAIRAVKYDRSKSESGGVSST